MTEPNLTAAELERLALLGEELGETMQAIGKILRHGYESTHPDGGPSNREALEREIGDVEYAIVLLKERGDIKRGRVSDWRDRKASNVHKYLHHQATENTR